jgi:hypothetical protein
MDAYSFLTELEEEQKVISQLLLNSDLESKKDNLEEIKKKIDSNSKKIDDTNIACNVMLYGGFISLIKIT